MCGSHWLPFVKGKFVEFLVVVRSVVLNAVTSS
jgi:hypothetical protein